MLILEQETDKLKVLTYAIEHKLAVSFWYVGSDFKEKQAKGKNPKQNWRRVYPVAIGTSKKSGKTILRAYQYQGVTNSFKRSDPPVPKLNVYKTFLLDEIKDGSVRIMYDRSGENLQGFTPPTYVDDYGKTAKFKGATDQHMSAVDTFFNTKDGADYTSKDYDITQPGYVEPEKPVAKPTTPAVAPKQQPKPVAPAPKAPTAPVPPPVTAKPVQPKPQPPKVAEPVNKITPPLEPEEDEEEWEEMEPVTESTGFFKWILNLSNGSK
jgi:hypothetical protein